MKTLALTSLVAATLAGCGTDHRKPDDGNGSGDDVPYTECAGDAASFVRQSFLALDGRRPKSQAEVDVYVELYEAVKAKGGDPTDAVARAIMGEPEFADRWIDTAMDAMRVQRLDIQNEQSCWDETLRTTVDSGLATAVRSMPATATTGDGKGVWTMLDLAKSAIALDDLTPVYRAQLFSMVAHPIPAANVDQVETELARRADFGDTFDSAFMHRDVVCLGCHTSERSVTDSDEPALDRHWPVAGLAENAVYGIAPGGSFAIDANRAHGAFRVDGFVRQSGTARPWGWDSTCGRFTSPASVTDDVAGIDTKLASVTGKRTTVYALEQSLAKGFDNLRGKKPPLDGSGAITDPDTALAWLVTLKMTEDVWRKATGSGLTIANYFPRNQASSDVLYALASRYTESGYSLKALLVAIVQSDYFNRKPAEDGCGAEPYTYPAVFDPWVISDADPLRRKNGPGDAVTAVDARTLVTATNAALGWPPPPLASRFPDYGEGCEDETSCTRLSQLCTGSFKSCCITYQATCVMNGVKPSEQVPFERGIGVFLRNSERGFRGLDFQARLVWENRFGTCARPAWVTSDFIDAIVAAAAADPSATIGDLAAAIKDRIVGEPAIVEASEISALEAVFGHPLASPASGATVVTARELCGALLGSPQFLLQGIAGRGGERPKLTPMDASFDTVCAAVAPRVAGASCTGGHLVVP